MKKYGFKEIAAENNISTKTLQRYLKPYRQLLNVKCIKRTFNELERQFCIEIINKKRKYKKLSDI